MSELVARTDRQLEYSVALGNGRQIGREIEELGDQVNHLLFPQDPAVDRHHAGAEHAPKRLIRSIGSVGRKTDTTLAIASPMMN